MTFQVMCPNRKECGKLNEVVLDEKHNTIHCIECDAEITGLTEFVKTQLRTTKQFRKPKKSTQAFAIKCNDCNKTLTPKVMKNELFCAGCGAKLKVADAFKKLVLTNVQSSGKVKSSNNTFE